MIEVDRDLLARDLVAAAYLKGDFVLRSGRRSNYYFDKYLFETQPSILRRVGGLLARMVPAGTQRLAAPELGAILLGGAVSVELGIPLLLVRKDAKDYGTAKSLEGRLEAGDRVTVIEDVLTTGGEAIKAAEKVREAGGLVIKLIAVLDREEGAGANLAAAGIDFEPLFTRSELQLG